MDVVPKENPDVCPAGLNDELNNEGPVFWPELKVLVPNVEGVAAPNVDVVPNPVVPLVLLPNNGVVVLFDAVWPKPVNPVLVDVDGILKADLFWLNNPMLCKQKFYINSSFNMYSIYWCILYSTWLGCVEPNEDPKPVVCPVLMPPKPVPAFWLVLLVANSGVGAAAEDKTIYTLLI